MKTHVESLVKAKKEEQKARLKEEIARKKERGDSPEDIAQYKANENFYMKRELKRTAYDAEREWNALVAIERASRGR